MENYSTENGREDRRAEGKQSRASAGPAAEHRQEPAGEKGLASGQPVKAEINGKIWRILTPEGSRVKKGDSVAMLEVMKLEVPVTAPCDGTLKALFSAEGDKVKRGQRIAVIA